MYYEQITVSAPLDSSEAVVAAMEAEGLSSLEEVARDEQKIVWRGAIIWDMEAEKLAGRLRARLKRLGKCGFPTKGYGVKCERLFFESPLPGWVLDEALRVVVPDHLGNRVVVKDYRDGYDPAPGEVVINLAPSRAFGNGAHSSTRLCCRALEKYLRRGDRVIDVGTGTGLLALAAGALGASDVLGVDTEPEAVSSATENVALNGLEAVVSIRYNDGLKNLEFGPSDVVIANILPWAIEAVTPDVMRTLKVGGYYILCGIQPRQVKELDYNIMHHGLEIVEVTVEEIWCCLVYQRVPVAARVS